MQIWQNRELLTRRGLKLDPDQTNKRGQTRMNSLELQSARMVIEEYSTRASCSFACACLPGLNPVKTLSSPSTSVTIREGRVEHASISFIKRITLNYIDERNWGRIFIRSFTHSLPFGWPTCSRSISLAVRSASTENYHPADAIT